MSKLIDENANQNRTYRHNVLKTAVKVLTLVFLSLMLFVLSACSIVDVPDENGGGGQHGGEELPGGEESPGGNAEGESFDEDYMVGLHFYIGKFDGTQMRYYPTVDFNDDKAWAFYEKTENTGGESYNRTVTSDIVSNISIKIGLPGMAPGGKFELTGEMFFTYEFIGGSINVKDVYVDKDNNYYTKPSEEIPTAISESLITTLSRTQTLSETKTLEDGSKETISYEGKFALQYSVIDYLVGANVIEFDKDNNVIKTSAIDIDTKSDLPNHVTSEDCEYVIIEEKYEVMHNSSIREKGTIYSERNLYKRNDRSKLVTLKTPNGDGSVSPSYFYIKF